MQSKPVPSFFPISGARRQLCGALVLGALASAGFHGPAQAQAPDAYPAKTVKFVVNFPPGGPADILARSVAAVLQDSFKQPVVVETKVGAAGNIGADSVAKSPADGLTVLFGIDTTFTVNPHIYKTMPFKSADLKPVLVMASSGMMVSVNPRTGIKSLKDLIAAGQTRTLSLSSAGNGSPGHLASAQLTEATQVKVNHIPYRGNTPAVTAILAGEVDGGILATPGLLPHVQAGKVTALAVTSRQRSQLAPEVPTVGELGLKNLEQEILYVVMVPAATPEPIVQTLQRALLEAFKRPDMQTRLNGLDLNFEGLTGAAASKRLADMSTRYGQIVLATDMKVE